MLHLKAFLPKKLQIHHTRCMLEVCNKVVSSYAAERTKKGCNTEKSLPIKKLKKGINPFQKANIYKNLNKNKNIVFVQKSYSPTMFYLLGDTFVITVTTLPEVQKVLNPTVQDNAGQSEDLRLLRFRFCEWMDETGVLRAVTSLYATC